ncbi:hypothetical protein KKF61_09195 [Patescibacteria group bacterium]|nr:hypothetical protein [Patescibacteria group bacterium]
MGRSPTLFGEVRWCVETRRSHREEDLRAGDRGVDAIGIGFFVGDCRTDDTGDETP